LHSINTAFLFICPLAVWHHYNGWDFFFTSTLAISDFQHYPFGAIAILLIFVLCISICQRVVMSTTGILCKPSVLLTGFSWSYRCWIIRRI